MAKGTLNKVLLIGRLGHDPELKYTPSGSAVCSFSIATNETYKDKDGKAVESTDWHRVVAWNKLAEICGQFLKKGSIACVEGKIKTRQYEGKDGQKRFVTEIIAERVEFIGNKTEQAEKHDTEEPPNDGLPF